MAMDFGNLNIKEIQKTFGAEGAASPATKKTEGGLASITESSGKSGSTEQKHSFSQGSPDLPPPSAGSNVEYSFLVISDEDIARFFSGSKSAKLFQEEAQKTPGLSNLNLILELRRAADREKIEDDGSVDVMRLLKRMLSKILDQLLSGNPDLSALAKDASAGLKLSILKEDHPQAEISIKILQDEGLKTDQEIADSLFGELEKIFKENGKIFSLESSFMPDALHQFAVQKLTAEGMTPEEAEEKANALLGAAKVQKQMTEWVDQMTKATVSEYAVPKAKPQSMDSLLSEITQLISGSSLPEGEKVSLSAFLKIVASAIKEIKELITEMMQLDSKKEREVNSNTLQANLYLKKLYEQANMPPEKVEELRKQMQADLDERNRNQLVQNHGRVRNLQGREDSLGSYRFSQDAEQMPIEQFKEILDSGDHAKLARLFAPPLGSEQGDALRTSSLVGALAKAAYRVAPQLLDYYINGQLEAGGQLKLDLVIKAIGLSGSEEILRELFEQLTGLKGPKLLGSAPLDQLIELILQAAEKERASNPDGADKILDRLRSTLSQAIAGAGTVEEKGAALTFAALLVATLTIGLKGPGELANEQAVPLVTAYLNDIGLGGLSLLKFMEQNGIAEGSEGGALGAIFGQAALTGLVIALLQGGGDPNDIHSCLNFLSTIAKGVDGAGFSGTLAKALQEALGLSDKDSGSLQTIFSGVLGAISGKEEESEGTSELIKLLKNTLKMLEALMQKLLGGGGDIPSDQVALEANKDLGKILEQFFMGLMQEIEKEQAESAAEGSIRQLALSEETSGSSPEAVQFLINSMLQAGLGPMNAGAGGAQAA